MSIVQAYFHAFRRGFTYDPRRNLYLWFGILWGCPIPVFSIALDLSLHDGVGRTVAGAIMEHPIHLFFLAHPLLFGLVFGAMGTIRNELAQDRAALIQKLTDLASLDALTGLRNRRVVMEELDAALHRAQRNQSEVSVVMFDLNGFKNINDTRGHDAGDEVLRKVADALKANTRQGEVLGRYGGDEFLLVVSGPLADEHALVLRANHAIHEATGLSVCAGAGRYPKDGTTPMDLIKAADRRMGGEKTQHYTRRGMTRRMT